MVDGTRLWKFSAVDFAVLVGTAVRYMLVGYLVFQVTIRRPRQLSVLGDY